VCLSLLQLQYKNTSMMYKFHRHIVSNILWSTFSQLWLSSYVKVKGHTSKTFETNNKVSASYILKFWVLQR
jgi:hypothetical protein